MSTFAVADDGVGVADGAAGDGTGVAGMHGRMSALTDLFVSKAEG
jgi:glucose-6-phosphate-specific signal transduction histidine kinase